MTSERLEELLGRFEGLRIAVGGDYFLDKYLDIDGALAEVSLETGLEAHQVVEVRCYPGAAGTVTNNLAALGVGEIIAVGAIGDDGEGFELRRGLERTGVRPNGLISTSELRTPTYTKPMLREPGRAPRELERLDIKNREPLPPAVERAFLEALRETAARVDGLIIADQVQERNCGVITDAVREALARLGDESPRTILLADSRARIGLFRHVLIKPNRGEALAAIGLGSDAAADEETMARAGKALMERTGRPLFITAGAEGIYAATAEGCVRVPAFRPRGPIDIVGAGDSVDAAVCAALCAGATHKEAALLGCLVSSLTIEQIGVTGTASFDAVRKRLREYREQQGHG
ncbi:MAG: PfkB family carbohydrate kinase [Candidatus Sumerlaeota bacterium]|nr:PfkB family carbohydrate kinase [Candidatus Sumerlaeota bacterium]